MPGSSDRVLSWVPDWSIKRSTEPIVYAQASPFFPKIQFLYHARGLRALGVSVATVEVVERFRLSDDPTAGRSYDLSLELRRIFHLSGFRKLASSSKVLLLSFFRMISSLEYSDFQIFDDTNLASLQQHEETLRNYVDAVEADNERQISNREKRQYQAASRSCMNRSLFATKVT